MRGLDERMGSSAIVEGAYRAVQIIYLDQNKWIDPARAVKYPRSTGIQSASLYPRGEDASDTDDIRTILGEEGNIWPISIHADVISRS
jgi:hypothetical protein